MVHGVELLTVTIQRRERPLSITVLYFGNTLYSTVVLFIMTCLFIGEFS